MSKNKNRKRPFRSKFKNQTEIGRLFGISSIKVGKILEQHGLKSGKSASKKAIDEQYAVFTPLKDGTPFYMWNADKVRQIVNKTERELSPEELAIIEIKNDLKEIDRLYNSDDGTAHKLADIMSDDLYGNISPDMARKIRYIPKLQLLLENGMDVGEALLGIIKYMNQNEIEDFKNAMSRHYPQYLDKLKTIITFQ